MGAKGTISSQTQSLVSMIQKGLQDLQELLQELNTSFQVDLHSCLTVESLHAKSLTAESLTVESLHKWKAYMRWVILRTNFLHPYSMLAIWRILSTKALKELYDGRLITTPTRSRTTLLFLKLHH